MTAPTIWRACSTESSARRIRSEAGGPSTVNIRVVSLVLGVNKMKTDAELQRIVLDELKWEPSVDAAHIGVSVKDGVVTLSGHVASYGEKYGAERAAKRVYGVQAVANELDVHLPGVGRQTDEDIA